MSLKFGTNGNNTLTGTGRSDLILGLGGDDSLSGKGGTDWLFGGSGNDILDGGNGSDLLVGGSGGDTLDGGRGRDKLFGGCGDDSLDGGRGRDKLFGGHGEDSLDGGKGRDHLFGGSDDDSLTGGEGNDLLDGGDGTDTAVFAGSSTDFDIQILVKNGVEVGFIVRDLNVADGNEGRDTLIGIEALVFQGDRVVITPATAIRLLDADGNFVGFFETIQDAVDAAGEDNTILVPDGSYREQIVVDGIDGLTIQALPGADVTIEAPDILVQTGIDPQNGRVIHAGVTIVNADGVTLQDIAVDGRALGDSIPVAGGDYVGVAVLDADAELTDVAVTGFRFDLDISGDLTNAQRGTGILASNSDGMQQGLTVTGGSVSDFQKNGITLRNVDAAIEDVTIVGSGPQSLIAQNGIQAGEGSTGRIESVDIAGIGFTGSPTSVAGLLLITGTSELDLVDNTLTGAGPATNSVGLFLTDGSGMEITGNAFSDVAFGAFENITTDGLVPNQIDTTNSYTNIGDTAYSVLTDPAVTDAVVRAGGDDNDGFIGSTGDDAFIGNGGSDFLFGDSGNDSLNGGEGADILEGAFGADSLSGGSGADQFVFAEGDGGFIAIDADTVTDYNLVDDEIGLAFGLTFGDLSIANDSSGNAVISVAATGEILATFEGIDSIDLNASEFVLI